MIAINLIQSNIYLEKAWYKKHGWRFIHCGEQSFDLTPWWPLWGWSEKQIDEYVNNKVICGEGHCHPLFAGMKAIAIKEQRGLITKKESNKIHNKIKKIMRALISFGYRFN